MFPMHKTLHPPVLKPEAIYNNPTRRLLENGCFFQLADILKLFHPHQVLLVLGEKSFRSSAYFSPLMEMLDSYQIIYSEPIAQNPTQAFVERELGRIRKEFSDCDMVLAIGGGSVIDVSKIFAAFLKNTVTLNAFLKGNAALPGEGIPLVAVPTTSGTGSEVTPYASLETLDQKKATLSHPHFYPRFALIDPELTYSTPSYVTASTGFDALSQAIESFWSVHATSFSRTHALRALELIGKSLDLAVQKPQDPEARFQMSLASCEAGLAIAQTKTTAVHAVSYPITAHFRVVHGHACALTLSSFIRFNAPVLKEEGRPLLNAFQAASYEEMANQVDHLMERIGLEKRLSSLKIQREGIDLILRDGFRPDRMKNNPREVTQEALREILNKIY